MQEGLIRLASGDKCGDSKATACAAPAKDDCGDDDDCCKDEAESESDDCCDDEGKCTKPAVATLPKAKDCADDSCCDDKDDSSDDDADDECCDDKGECASAKPVKVVKDDCCGESGSCTKPTAKSSRGKACASRRKPAISPDSESDYSSCDSDADTLDDPLRRDDKCQAGPSKPCRRRRARRQSDPIKAHKHQPCREANCTTRKKRRSDRTMCGCCVKSMMGQPSAQSKSCVYCSS